MKQPKTHPFTLRKFFTFLIFLAIVCGVGYWGAKTADGFVYADLQRPSWEIPYWIGNPVWIALYFLMAGAGYFLWRAPHGKKRSLSLLFWAVQLFLYGLWPYLFFTLNKPVLAAWGLIVMTLLTLFMILIARKIARGAVFCLIPYLLWIAYSAALYWEITLLNPLNS